MVQLWKSFVEKRRNEQNSTAQRSIAQYSQFDHRSAITASVTLFHKSPAQLRLGKTTFFSLPPNLVLCLATLPWYRGGCTLLTLPPNTAASTCEKTLPVLIIRTWKPSASFLLPTPPCPFSGGTLISLETARPEMSVQTLSIFFSFTTC